MDLFLWEFRLKKDTWTVLGNSSRKKVDLYFFLEKTVVEKKSDKVTVGGGGSKNRAFYSDVINEWPLSDSFNRWQLPPGRPNSSRL